MPDVLNPSPVPLRLRSASVSAYSKLAAILRDASDLAAKLAVDEQVPRDQRPEWFAVRDTLRTAAIEALVPRGGTGRPRCRRCGIDCRECTPPAAALSDDALPDAGERARQRGLGESE